MAGRKVKPTPASTGAAGARASKAKQAWRATAVPSAAQGAAPRRVATGPVSEAGKARSSLNAVSHGLTSSRVLPDEVQLVESYVRELTEHYEPQSPLEALQIQRIALCRAKLAKLMDIELAGRELALSRAVASIGDRFTPGVNLSPMLATTAI